MHSCMLILVLADHSCFILFFFLIPYLFLKDRENISRGRAERDGGRISEAGSALSSESRRGFKLTHCEAILSWRWTLNPPGHAGALTMALLKGMLLMGEGGEEEGKMTVTGGGHSQANGALGSLKLCHACSCRCPHSVLTENSSRGTLTFMHDAKLRQILGEATIRKVSKCYEAL